MSTRRSETDLAVQMLRLTERVSPATPPTGTMFAYAKTDGLLYTRNDAGDEVAYTAFPWTVLKLAADFQTTSNQAQDVTGLGFTPAANTTYLIEGFLPSLSSTGTTGVQLGLAGPTTGLTYSVLEVRQPISGTAESISYGVLNQFNTATTGFGIALSRMYSMVSVGASPGAGNIRVQLKSEINNSAVTIKAGAVLMYREV